VAYVDPKNAVYSLHGVYESSKSAACSLYTNLVVARTMFFVAKIPVWGSFMLLSLPPSFAQETTIPNNLRFCPYIGDTPSPDYPVNSTGPQSFRWSQQAQDWYLTTTLNDTRSPFLETQMHDIQGYISAPANTEASACVYMLRGINATGGGDDDCEGVLSRGCREWLTKTVSFMPENARGVSRCARTPSKEDVTEACGAEVVLSYSTGQFYS
jgi:hypothetical protein